MLHSTEAENLKFTVISNWADIGKTEHFVQFYPKDELLVSAVSGYVAGAFKAAGAAVLIATPEHRTAIEARLSEEGFDLRALTAACDYVPLDAREMLSKFMVDGMPHETRFKNTMGTLIQRITHNGKQLRAFGEMVALLWAEGNRDAAIRLEDLWNGLAKVYSFGLFCAYPLHSFEHPNAAPFVHICQQHSRVVSTGNCC